MDKNMDFSLLSELLKVPSKELMLKLFDNAASPALTTSAEDQMTEYGITSPTDVAVTLSNFISHVVFFRLESSEILNMFPDSFDERLTFLIVKICQNRLPHWTESRLHEQVSHPRLKKFKWNLLSETSLHHTESYIQPPYILYSLQITDKENTNEDTSCHAIKMDLSDVSKMLNGMQKIRDQLHTIASHT